MKGRLKLKSTDKKEKSRMMIPKDRCRNCGKGHKFGKCPALIKHVIIVRKVDTIRYVIEQRSRNTVEQNRLATVDTVYIYSLRNGMETRPMLDIHTKIGSRDLR